MPNQPVTNHFHSTPSAAAAGAATLAAEAQRMLLVSNRLPVTLEWNQEQLRIAPSSGGLVTALRPLLQHSHGWWIGWTGTDASAEVERRLAEYTREHDSFSMAPIFMSEPERRRFYSGFSNEVLWPLFHDLQSRCNFDPDYWDTYYALNDRFAEKTQSLSQPGDLIWVHDYHLMSTATCLRKRGVQDRLLYFHHIPFPSPDIFEKLPWRKEILMALLDYDVVGFQTLRDRRSFIACLRKFAKEVEIEPLGHHLLVREPGRNTLVGAFPISIDFEEFARAAGEDAVTTRARELVESVRGAKMVLGVDRLDYTKGIPERLAAFEYLLEHYEAMRGRVTLVQIVVPSREDIPEYELLKNELEQRISHINGKYGGPDWVPVHYLHRSLDRTELLAYYRATDVSLVTPLKDGMNLVSKEYCAARVENDGVLVLSEFAGSAVQLKHGALLVNPNHTAQVAEALHRALTMPKAEQRTRMRSLRSKVRRDDVFAWREGFFQAVAMIQDLPAADASATAADGHAEFAATSV